MNWIEAGGPWAKGMATLDGRVVIEVMDAVLRLGDHLNWKISSVMAEEHQPDPTDPATLGAMLGAVREAWGADAYVCVYHQRSSPQWEVAIEWMDGRAVKVADFYGATEAEALAAAYAAAQQGDRP